MNEFENARHDRIRKWWWAFGETPDELVEELFCRNLKVEWISAHLDKGIEQSEGEERDVRIAVIHCLDDKHRGFSRAG
jgi:hypothetical protein